MVIGNEHNDVFGGLRRRTQMRTGCRWSYSESFIHRRKRGTGRLPRIESHFRIRSSNVTVCIRSKGAMEMLKQKTTSEVKSVRNDKGCVRSIRRRVSKTSSRKETSRRETDPTRRGPLDLMRE